MENEKKNTIEDMQKLAKNKGGECQSKSYINAHTKLTWICVKGHQWDALPGNIIKGHWCPICARKTRGNRKYSIEYSKQIAKEKKGLCLSNEYINSHGKLRWKCSEGHEWDASLSSIINNKSWCPVCSRKILRQKNLKYTLDDMINFAKEKGGDCLSTSYTDIRTKLKWRCSEGHVWEATPNSIISGRWCHKCGIKKRSEKQRLTLDEMKELAIKNGGQCLSTNYVNANSKLKWQCSQEHIWEAIPSSVKAGTWCPICAQQTRADKLRGNLNRYKEIALTKGGECLSQKYVNVSEKLKWRCAEGHEWEATPNAIQQGSWCPFCAGKNRTIEDMNAIAKERGGICLSKEYRTASSKLLWRCSKGHEWEAITNSVIRGSWCPYCAGQKGLDITTMKAYAERMGGECLSKIYVNSREHLKWRCDQGHIWSTSWSSIQSGSWCPKCSRIAAGKKRRLSLDIFKEMAQERGGECLSKEYINSTIKLKWRCKEGHEWKALPNNIKKGHWCSKCMIGFNERVCKELFETIFDDQFPKARPKWLINPMTGHSMELDGYNEELGIAFEYNGPQHYEYIPLWDNKLNIQKEKDILKLKNCEEMGVLLIVIPYYLSFNEKRDLIIKKIQSRPDISIDAKLSLFDGSFKFNELYSPDKLEQMKRIALSRGGECLSKHYKGSDVKLKWKCSKGHVWETTPDSIVQGHWCPKCGKERAAKQRLLTIESMKEIAKERGGRCLSKKYISASTKLRWSCSEGHEWDATPNSIKNGNWCPYCRGYHQTIEDMQKIAKSRGGKCLSIEFISATAKLRWQCSQGHIWDATPNLVKNHGTWCKKCANEKLSKDRRSSIETMKGLAQKKGGECLSTEYINAHTKLKWRCSEGHEWETVPMVISRGGWCPICAKKKRTEGK